jgi:hypothetical protein
MAPQGRTPSPWEASYVEVLVVNQEFPEHNAHALPAQMFSRVYNIEFKYPLCINHNLKPGIYFPMQWGGTGI